MATIHLIDGEKGGVGKSLFARVMVQYCLDKNYPYTLVDADRSNPDVGETYPDSVEEHGGKKIFHYQKAIFSESERKAYEADQIFELALAKPVIVNLPAQVAALVNDWITRNDLLNLSSQYSVDLCKWFVCPGSYDSLKLFIDSVKHFEGQVRHILVRNLGMQDDWTTVTERQDLNDLISKYAIAQMDLPKFSYRERDYVEEHRLSFEQARDRQAKHFTILGYQRVHDFLRKAFQEIDRTEVWHQLHSANRAAKNTAKNTVTANEASK